ncbi:NUDIX hydrolase [Lentzea sp. HUAS TT2]|uniref:NUDIX hydrolase n=1 Tax=Lentzea sp. HUAS TT2 TaxID=3447454 RepID=UPI003F7108AC
MTDVGTASTPMGSIDPIEVLVTADLVILTIQNGILKVALVVRGEDPFEGQFALPGGFLRVGENNLDAAKRELEEETGLDPGRLALEQVGSYSDVDRDPRGRVITCAFLAIAPDLPNPRPRRGSDARSASWVNVFHGADIKVALAFDHDQILRDAIRQAQRKLQYSTIATAFCLPEFTIGELREVYEAVWNTSLDRANFHRKVKNASEFIVPTGRTRHPKGNRGRPAELYRAGEGVELLNPILRGTLARS